MVAVLISGSLLMSAVNDILFIERRVCLRRCWFLLARLPGASANVLECFRVIAAFFFSFDI